MSTFSKIEMELTSLFDINIPSLLFSLEDLIKENEETPTVNMLTILCLVNPEGITFDLLRKLFFYIHPNKEILSRSLATLVKALFVVKKGDLIVVNNDLQNLIKDEIGLVNNTLPWMEVSKSILKEVIYDYSLTNTEIPEIMNIWANASRDENLVFENISTPCHLIHLLEKFLMEEEAIKTGIENNWKKIFVKFAKANLTLFQCLEYAENKPKLQNQLTRLTTYLSLSKEKYHEQESEEVMMKKYENALLLSKDERNNQNELIDTMFEEAFRWFEKERGPNNLTTLTIRRHKAFRQFKSTSEIRKSDREVLKLVLYNELEEIVDLLTKHHGPRESFLARTDLTFIKIIEKERNLLNLV